MARKTNKLVRHGDDLVPEHFVDPEGEEHSIYDLDIDEIVEHCESIEGVGRQLYYLEYVLKQRRICLDHQLNYGIYDVDRQSQANHKRLTEDSFARFERRLKLEIDFREKILPITKTTRRARASKVRDTVPPNGIVEKIEWQGETTQLAYLIFRLVELKLWPAGKQWALVAKNFVDRNGKPLTSQSLTSAFAKLTRNINKKPKLGDGIDHVLAATLKVR